MAGEIELITNQIWPAAARCNFTDLFGANSDAAALSNNATSGGRHLYAQALDNAAKHFRYINMNGGLGCNRLILCNQRGQIGENVKIVTWPSSYPSGGTIHSSFTLASGDLIGPGQQDYYYTFSPAVSGKYAIGVELNGTTFPKRIGKLYCGTAYTFNNVAQPPIFRTLWSQVQIYRQVYLVEKEASFVFDMMTAAEVQSLESLYGFKTEPYFLYDSTGYLIAEKLWHGVTLAFSVQQRHDNLYTARLQTARLRHYS